jgi:hypothetical protein
MSTLATTNLKHPSATGNNVVLAADGSATIATLSSTTITGTTIQGVIKSGTAVASTSGTSIDFTNIPSWVKRITVMFSGVSTNGTSLVQVQLGSGTFTTSGYSSAASDLSSGVSTSTSTTGILFTKNSGGADVRTGMMRIANVTGNTWIGESTSFLTNAAVTNISSGQIALSGTLDRIRITTVNGTDTFDAGTINILYEG